MDVQQIMEMLIEMKANRKADQEKAEGSREESKEMMKAMREEIKSDEAEMRSIVNAWMADIKDARKKTTACHEETEANAEKTERDRGMMQSVAEHQVAFKEDAVVKPVKGQKKRHRGTKPAAGQCGDPKELTRSDCGSGKKLAAACRKVQQWHGEKGTSWE
jgi:seryl-tRNA synthetase